MTDRDRDSRFPDRDETPFTESESPPASETTPRQPGLLRDIVSGLAILVGLAGAVMCLAHLGPWATGLVVSILAICLGVAGALHRDTGETGTVQHLIEIRHTEDGQDG